MTVTNTLNRYQYLGNGVTTSFAFPPVFLEDLGVVLFNTVSQTPVTITLNGGGEYDYTISGVIDPNTGEYLSGASVVFNSPPPPIYTVTIYRNEPITQEVIFTANGPLPAETLNTSLDKSTMIEQQLYDNVIRAIRAPWMDPPPPSSPQMVLPSVALRAGMLVSFDSDGNVIVVAPSSGGGGGGGGGSGAGVVANIAMLRLTAGAAGATVLLAGYFNAGDKPVVMYVANSSDARPDDGGLVITNPAGGRWNLSTFGKPFNVLDWGAYRYANAVSDTAFTKWFAAVIVNEVAGYIPAGHYIFAAQQYWDLSASTPYSVKIIGDGSGNTLLDFDALGFPAPVPNLLIGASPGPGLFNCTFDGFAVAGYGPGPVLQLGHEDFSDPINTSRLGFDFKVTNNADSSSACAVEVNSWLNGILWGQFDCNGHGDALRLRQVQYSQIGGQHSSADTGHHWTGGVSYGNAIISTDIEGVSVAVLSDVTSASSNTYIGGQIDWFPPGPGVNLVAASNYFRFIGTAAMGDHSALIGGADAASVIWEDQFVGTAPFGAVLVMPASGIDAGLAIASASGHISELALQQQDGGGGQLQRWSFTKNADAESGGNAGSNFILTRYGDDGVQLDNPVSIMRETGVVSFPDGVAGGAGAVFGWYGATPTTQPTGGIGMGPATVGTTGVVYYDTAWTGAEGSTQYTIYDVVSALKKLGLIEP